MDAGAPLRAAPPWRYCYQRLRSSASAVRPPRCSRGSKSGDDPSPKNCLLQLSHGERETDSALVRLSEKDTAPHSPPIPPPGRMGLVAGDRFELHLDARRPLAIRNYRGCSIASLAHELGTLSPKIANERAQPPALFEGFGGPVSAPEIAIARSPGGTRA
jgi:hypothetical protein